MKMWRLTHLRHVLSSMTGETVCDTILFKGGHMKKNKFQNDLDDLKNWQDNQYNRGYFLGSGNIPRPTLMLCKKPKLLIYIGILFAILSILCIIYIGMSSGTIWLIILSIVFLLGGFLRLNG